MIEWLGIGHLFELSGTEAIWGFLTPLVIFVVFFLAQLILPARRVTGYVVNPGDRRAPQLPAKRSSDLCNRGDRLGVRANRDAA